MTRLVVVLVAAAFPGHRRRARPLRAGRHELAAAAKLLVTTALGAGIGAAVVGVRLMTREEVPT